MEHEMSCDASLHRSLKIPGSTEHQRCRINMWNFPRLRFEQLVDRAKYTSIELEQPTATASLREIFFHRLNVLECIVVVLSDR